MFDNIGKKIKTLAKVLVWIGIIAALVLGIVFLVISGDVHGSAKSTFVFSGLIFLIAGPFLCWISCFFIYGFGELIDKTCDIQAAIGGNGQQSDINLIQKQKKEKLDRVLRQGLITQDEYDKAMGQV